MSDAISLASIVTVATAIGPYIYDAIKMLADKGVAEPLTQPVRNWLRKGPDHKKEQEALRTAIQGALEKIRPSSDEWENLLLTIHLTGLTANQGRLVAAAAVEMRVNDPAALPEELLDVLDLDPSRKELLAQFLFELREQLAHSTLKEYQDAIRYTDELDQRSLLRGLTRETLTLIAVSERRLSIEEAMIRQWRLTTNEPEALRKYLEYVRKTWEILPLPLIRKRDPDIKNAHLKQVFVPLTMRDQKAEEKTTKQRQKRAHPDSANPEEETKPLSIGDLLNRRSRFILLGKPGSGKSTLLHRIALAFAEGNAGLDLGWNGRTLLPIFIRLRNFAVYLEEHHRECVDPLPGSLVAYLDNYYRGETTLRIPLTADFFDQRLEAGECFVLLDGLDEVTGNRTEVAQHINAFITYYASKGNHIGLASRPAGFEAVKPDLQPASLAPIEVNPLDPEGIRDLIKNLFLIIESDSRQAEQNARQLTQEILLRTDLIEIASTPLFCAALVQVWKYASGELPERLVDVLQEIVDLLLGFWKNQDYELAKKDELAKEDGTGRIQRRLPEAVDIKRRRLSYLADWMQQSLRKAEVETKPAIDTLIDFIQNIEGEKIAEKASEAAQGFLENSHERSGILVESDPGVYSFVHKAFMEYLAALALVKKSKTLVNTLLEHTNDDWWTNVTLFAGAHSETPDDVCLELVDQLVARWKRAENIHSATITDLLLAGRLTRDISGRLPGQVIERVKNELHAVMIDPAFPPNERASAGDVLDDLGYQPEGLFHFMPIPGRSKQRSDIEPCTHLPDTYYLAKFPVTNLQYERFLQKENFTDSSLWQAWPKVDENSQLMPGQDWGNKPWQWLQAKLQENDNPLDRDILYPRYWHDPRFGIARKCVPVVGISWYEAMAYSNWLERNWDKLEEGQENSIPGALRVRLPTDLEWETAAGKQEWVKAKQEKDWQDCYPWDAPGQVTTKKDEILLRANVEDQVGRTTPVGMYPLGVSYPYGLSDLAGNVWEWQVNYRDKDHDFLGLRGGSWVDNLASARPSLRDHGSPSSGWGYLSGFRVVVSPS